MISLTPCAPTDGSLPYVAEGANIFQVLHALERSPRRQLQVREGDRCAGVIDTDSLLHALCDVSQPGGDDCVIEVECAPADYSASLLAHAVEDVDAHLTDLLTTTTPEGMVRVTLRVRHRDPSAAVHSLERYGFRVIDASGDDNIDLTALDERLAALNVFLNV